MGVAERRAREREARKESIIAAAAAAFREHGFDAATVESIAAAAEVNVATVYYYFASKDLLFLAVLERAVALALPEMETAARGEGTARERLLSLARAYYRLFRVHPEAETIVRCLQTKEIDPADEESRAIVLRIYQGTRHALGVATRLIAEATRRGEFREVDPRETAALFWAGLNGVFQMAENKGVFREQTEGALLERWVDLWCAGLERR